MENKNKQLIHIHGGQWFNSYERYFAYLISKEIDNPNEPKIIKWQKRYEEFLGDNWQIIRPQMPSPQNSKYEEWKLWFEKYFQYLEDGITLVGHSLGATFLAQYLSEEVFPREIHSLHLIAPSFDGEGGFGLDERVSNISKQLTNIYLYHSKDDPIVPYDDSEKIHKLLPTAKFATFENMGHFSFFNT